MGDGVLAECDSCKVTTHFKVIKMEGSKYKIKPKGGWYVGFEIVLCPKCSGNDEFMEED